MLAQYNYNMKFKLHGSIKIIVKVNITLLKNNSTDIKNILNF